MGARKYIGRLQELPTPFYFYDMDLLRSTLATAVSEASRYGYRIHYALKANFDPRIVETIRRVCIITKKEEELRHFIINDLHSGATIYESIGAYNLEKRNEIITIVDKSEYQKLMNYINREDPHAFITVYTVSDIRYQPKK